MFTPGLRGRGYKTVSGRHEWPNRDPIREQGGLNLYVYCGNNPINGIDPRGEFLIGAIIGTISGVVSGIAGAVAQGGSTREIVTSAIVGGVIGGVVGALDPTEGVATEALIQAGAIGATAGYAGSIAGQLIANPSQYPSASVVADDTVGGALGGVTGQYGFGTILDATGSELGAEGTGAIFDFLGSMFGTSLQPPAKTHCP
jgi:hypothetical protein